MENTIYYSFVDKDKEIKFVIQRLKPFDQFNLILRIIGIISKGSTENSKQVEQILHNLMQTGKEVDDIKKVIENSNPLNLLLTAIKGALANLSEIDRDWLIKELLKNVKIELTDGINTIHQKATIEELNERLSGFKPVMKLLMELLKINLGFL